MWQGDLCESSFWPVSKFARTFWWNVTQEVAWAGWADAALAELFKFKTPESELWLDDTPPPPPTMAPPPRYPALASSPLSPARDAFVDNERIFDSFSSKPLALALPSVVVNVKIGWQFVRKQNKSLSMKKGNIWNISWIYVIWRPMLLCKECYRKACLKRDNI